MLKFFRRIRQKLLTENKFRKYLLYAIGEIILVMIGILMALQVNNWNNERLEDKKETKILREFQRNLQANVIQFTSEIDKQQTIVHDINIIIENVIIKLNHHFLFFWIALHILELILEESQEMLLRMQGR